jgi:diaminopimelate decarboxylase
LSVVELADTYKTPLYLFDGLTIYEQIRTLQAGLRAGFPGTSEITYAAKAYFSLEMARRLAKLNLGVDVVSLGELGIAREAGFAPERVHLHGNNKSAEEIDFAIHWGVQSIVVDSLDELAFLEERAKAIGKSARIWLRITPGVAVDTHPYRQTAHAASKFGLAIQGGSAEEGIRRAQSSQLLQLKGLHTHLGSQVFEAEPYSRAVKMLLDAAEQCGFIPEELSPGGGWGVPYTCADEDNDPSPWIAAVCGSVQSEYTRRGWKLPKLIVEPGRWLVARAGLAVYTIGTNKVSGDGANILAVDGGMADNLRPALYHAVYTACVVERPDAEAVKNYRVVGKFCESGDELIHETALPAAARGEHLAMPAAGAYHLSMASNYNLAARPAVLWLEDQKVEVLQKRCEVFDEPWWLGR